MENITYITEDILLEKYEPDKHASFVKSLDEDQVVKSYFKSGDNLYILRYKGKYAGFYLFHRLGYLKNSITMECGIVKEFRSDIKTGQKGIGSEVLKAITEYLLSTEADNIVLEIAPNNVASIKSALNCGYCQYQPLQEIFYQEGYNKTPYVKSN